MLPKKKIKSASQSLNSWLSASRHRRQRCVFASGLRLRLETLEDRTVLSPVIHPDYVVYNPNGTATPTGQPSPWSTAFSPSQVVKGYGFDQVKVGGIQQQGQGQTVVIIDAFDDPAFVSATDITSSAFLASDLHQFDLEYNLPESNGFFTKMDQRGGTDYPTADSGWDGEISLDVEWVHALAPLAKIILMEGDSAGFSDLFSGAAAYAGQHDLGSVVTMSFGSGEFNGETSFQNLFNASGVSFLESTGDNGSTGSGGVDRNSGFAGFLPNVVAVGGTSLSLNSNGTYNSESGWSGGGGGLSSFISQPSYQSGITIHSGTSTVNPKGKRAEPDVSMIADPNTGVSVYDSVNGGTSDPWFQVGGTSLASPSFAAVMAIANEIRADYNLAPLTGATDTLPDLYSLMGNSTTYSDDFHDVTTGSNAQGFGNRYSAGTGYDLVTGIGTPKVPGLVTDLAGAAVTSVSSTTANGTYGTGDTISIQVNFTTPVTVDTSGGTPTLSLNSGGTATYTSGSGTNTLTFTYTIANGDGSPDLDYTSATAISLNGGSIKHWVTGATASLVLPSPAATGSLGANANLVIQTGPRVTNVTSTTANGTYGPGSVISIQLTFDSVVNVTGTPQLALNSGGTASYTSGSGTNVLTFTYTVASGDNSPDLDAASATALSLNGGTIESSLGADAFPNLPIPGATGSLGANKNIVIDAIPLAVKSLAPSLPNGFYGVGMTVPIQVTFNKPAFVTGTPQLALNSGGTASYTSGSGTNTLTFTYTIAAPQNVLDLDEVSSSALTLNGGTILDKVNTVAALTLPVPGTPGTLGYQRNVTIDTIPPSIVSMNSVTSDGTYGVGATISIQVTFSETLFVTGTPQLALNSGGTASYTSGSGTNVLTFTYTVAAGQNSADLDSASTSALSLNGGAITDLATNPSILTLPTPGVAGSLGAVRNIVISTPSIGPTVTNVSSTTPNGSYGTGSTVSIQLTFGQPVNVTGTPQLALNSGGTASYTSGSGTNVLTFTYTVAAGQNSADLDSASTSALSLNGGTIKDTLNNNAPLALPTPGGTGSLGANDNIVINTTGATVTGITSSTANGTYGAGATVSIQVTFSKPVNVTGAPSLGLNSGGTAKYFSGSGTNVLTFTYAVASPQNAADLDSASTSALSLNGGTIKDTLNNTAILTLPTPGGSGSLGTNKNIVIKTPVTGPTITNVTSSATNKTYGPGTSISIQVTFNSSVTVTGKPTLPLNSGGTATYASGSGTTTLTFTYTVAAGQTSADLDYTSTSALALNGGTIKDAKNNIAILTLPTPGGSGSLGANKNIAVDAIPPAVQHFYILSGLKKYDLIGSNLSYIPWEITGIQVVFSEPIISGDLSSLSATGLAKTQLTGLGTNTLTWGGTTGVIKSISAVLLGNGPHALKDAGGNALGGGSGFTEAFKVLVGDVNDDGHVTNSDANAVKQAINQPYNPLYDINGDGSVDSADYNFVLSLVGN